MYKKWSAFLFPLTFIVLIAALTWGFQVREEKNTMLIKAENQYQRAFHELNDNIAQLQYELAKIRMLNSEQSQRKALANVWRLTNVAQNNISQLPLALLPFHETQQLLHNISAFSYRTSVRDMRKQPLSTNEKKLLNELYRRTGEIAGELRNVQTAVMRKQLRWMDVEVALSEEREQKDNAIIDGFKLVNQKVVEFEEMNWGPSARVKHLANEPLQMGNKPLAADELKKRAQALVGGQVIRQVRDRRLQKRGVEQWIVRHRSSGQAVSVQLNRFNGQPLMFLHSRAVGQAKLSPEEAMARVIVYMKKHAFPTLEAVAYDHYERTASITFVENKHKILYYPHKVVVNVALDNGEIIGLQSQLPFKDGPSTPPFVTAGDVIMSQVQVRKFLEPDFAVRSIDKAVIEDERGQRVLCYQVEGMLDKQHYRIFLNALDGREEQVERLNEVEI